jgi:glycosyltransferase involved in cell wall biosynthesis
MTQAQPFLSVAIPTYNRAEQLDRALASLFAEIDSLDADAGGIEVVVCSNGSTDRTDAVARSWAARRPELHYYVNDKNYGIDENIRRVARHTSGAYIRLLSDDDVLVPGSLRALVHILRTHPGIGFLFLNAATLTEEQGVAGVRAPVIPPTPSESDPAGVYCLQADEFIERIGVWLSFVSSFVVQRTLWVNQDDDQAYVGTDLFLSYKALDAIAASGRAWFSAAIAVGVRPHFSGSYRIFNAFGPEMRKLFLTHATARGFDAARMGRVWERAFNEDLLPRVGRARLSGTFKKDERKVVRDVITGGPKVRLKAMLLMSAPLWLLNGSKSLRKLFMAKQAESWPFIALD